MEGYPIQTNYSAGEVSPLLQGRVDISKYANGVQKLENFIVKPQGAITRRSGTRYVASVKIPSKLTRVRKFQFSNGSNYMLEFGETYIRFYKNGVQLLNSGTPVEVVTPYQASDLYQLRFAQSADQLYIVHPNYPQSVLSRYSDVSWAFGNIVFTDGQEDLAQDGPYLDVDARNYTLSIANIGGGGGSSIASTNADFSSGSVGKYILLGGKAYVINAFISTKIVNVTFVGNVDTTSYTNGTYNFSYSSGSKAVNSTLYTGGFITAIRTDSSLPIQWGFVAFADNSIQNGVVQINSIYYLTGQYGTGSAGTRTNTDGSILGINFILTLQSTSGTLIFGGVVPSINNQITLTSSAADFSSASVGLFVEYNFKGNLVVGKIIQVINTTTVLVLPFDNIVDYTTLDPRTAYTYVATAITIRGVTFIGKLDASIGVWSTNSEYAYVKVNGSWYHSGFHADATEAIGGISQDVLGVQAILSMQTVTGNLSYSNHIITTVVNSSAPTFNSSTDVGRCLRMNFNSLQVWGIITAVSSTTSVSLILGRMIPNDPQIPTQLVGNGQTSIWRLGAWYVGNYPSAISFHEQRLVFGATNSDPQTIDFSNSGDYFNFAPTDDESNVTDSHAIRTTIASNQVNAILWFRSSIGVLLIGTNGAEWEASSSSFGTPLSPSNIVLSEQTNHGTLPTAEPQKVGARILFLQNSGNKIKELSYFFQTNSYIANDITILSEHIMKSHGGGVITTYQQEPNNIVWIINNDGTLSAITYDYAQEIQAWHHHTIGGAFSSGTAVVESIDTIPSVDGTEDTLWMVVKRTVNGSTCRYIEYIEKEFMPSSPTDKNSMYFMDCCKTVTLGSSGNTLTTAASHLVGQTVNIVADGSLRTSVVVPSDGTIVFDGLPATVITFGLSCPCWMVPLPIESGSANGTSQGKQKRITKITLRLLNTLGFKYGKDLNTLTQQSFRNTNDPIGNSPPLFTGDRKFEIAEDYQLQGLYAIKQDQPYPLTIVCAMPQLQAFQ